VKKLELGGGSSPKRKELGFLNCDIRDLPEVDLQMDLKYPFPLIIGSSSVEEIFSAHCLEHFTEGEARGLLWDCHRVLIPGGRIELIVPNIRKLAERYLHGEYDCETFSRMVYGGQDYPENFHKIGFDFSFLAHLLDEAGFVGIKQVQCEDGNEFGLEARKPGDAE